MIQERYWTSIKNWIRNTYQMIFSKIFDKLKLAWVEIQKLVTLDLPVTECEISKAFLIPLVLTEASSVTRSKISFSISSVKVVKSCKVGRYSVSSTNFPVFLKWRSIDTNNILLDCLQLRNHWSSSRLIVYALHTLNAYRLLLRL